MNVLLFDAGNTRFKWALFRNGRLSRQQAVAHGDFPEFGQWLASAPRLERVAGVNVAGSTFERSLRRTLRMHGHAAPQFITSSATAAGVRNGYSRPSSLGADRWAAAVAAWHGAGGLRPACAVSIGTALTIDLVDHDGYHRGGLIAPGPSLMRDSLLRETADIALRATRPAARVRRRDARRVLPPLANATRAAVGEGCLGAAAGFIDSTIDQLTCGLGKRPVVFVTGGAAADVIPRLRSDHRRADDLVLRGVAALAGIPLQHGS